VSLVLDASAALAWIILRNDAAEARLARRAFDLVLSKGAAVPALWYAEVANTLLVFERAQRLTEQDSVRYLADLALLAIAQDEQPSALLQQRVLDLGRLHNLSAYDATFLELAMRQGDALATFDRKLATAARAAGVLVFGDSV